VALSEKLLKELSYGSRFTFVANWHSDSNHPSDLATRRPARLGVTNTAAKGSGGHRRGPESLDLGAYLTDVCKDITASISSCEINVSAEQGIVIATDRAITIVLLVNELVTNAIKHAYPQTHCRLWVTLSRKAEGGILVSVRDEGVGLPADFDVKNADWDFGS
jgi:hypothetical protein